MWIVEVVEVVEPALTPDIFWIVSCATEIEHEVFQLVILCEDLYIVLGEDSKNERQHIF